MMSYSPSRLLRIGFFAALTLNMVLAAPAGPTGAPEASSVLIQVVNGKTKHFPIGGSYLTWDPALAPTSAAQPTIRPAAAGAGGLVAIEQTEVVTRAAGSILVQYYQENNSKAPHASYATPPGPVVPPPIQTGLAELPPDPAARKWVDLHNRARAPFGAGKLQWREDLVARAKANADLCTGDHSNAGENIAAQSGDLSAEQTVKWWMAEEVFYNWDNPVFEGHFTQAVWKNSQYVGCYTTKCAAGTVFDKSFGVSYQSTCEYDPVGNYVNPGEFARNVGKRQSGIAPWTP